MGGKSGGVVGYKYYMSLHMGLGRTVNSIKEIRVGDLTAWTGDACTSDLILINAPNLFGGDEKEGGIVGPCKVYFGKRDQVLSGAIGSPLGTLPAIKTSLGGDVPEFRGVTTLWFDGMVCAMNPYPKEWAFRVQRSTAGWADDDCWYQAKATIYMTGPEKVEYKKAITKGDVFKALFDMKGGSKAQTVMMEIQGNISAMNGAHILFQAATDPDWGRGLARDMLDHNSYIACANQLCAEGFGLCIPWYRQESVKEFSKVVIDTIGAAQYVDRETGLLTLRLIRGDYDPATLPLFTPDSGLLGIDEDDASSQEQAYNEIIVKGFDPKNKEEFSVRAQNLASVQALGEIISNTIEYRGIPTRDLAARVAMRELKAQTSLRRMTVRLDRRAWRLAPAGLFRISHPKRNIANMVLRIGEITEMDSTTGEIQVKAVQDVFGLPATSYYVPQEPGWGAPDFSAHPADNERLVELSYRDVYRLLDPANRDALDVNSALLGALVEKPTPSAITFDLATRTGANPFEVLGTYQPFTNTAVLDGALTPLAGTMTIEPKIGFDPADGAVAQIDDEVIQIVSFDPETNVAVILRGTTDTIPAAHADGAVVWLLDSMGVDGKEYAAGEEVDGKALTRTSTDLLTEDEADTLTLELVGRFGRPYPPGNVQVGGISIYGAVGQQTIPILTWTHRDRVAQADAILGHEAASTGPEPGTTYNVRVYDLDDNLLREETGIAADTWTYDEDMQGLDDAPNKVRMELESERDDLVSTFKYSFVVTLNGGYGLGYGLNYGGA